MNAATQPKLLTPLTLGSMDLAHRAVVLAGDGLSAEGIAGLATPGGLIIHAPSASDVDWRGLAAVLHGAGGLVIASLPADAPATQAKAAMAGGCDGLELRAEGLEQSCLLRQLDAALPCWGAARLGVRLHCGAAALDAAVGLLAALNELELAFVHLQDPPAGAAERQRLRQAFRWPLIASGGHGPEDAKELVESRWADAIGFAVADGPALLRCLGAG